MQQNRSHQKPELELELLILELLSLRNHELNKPLFFICNPVSGGSPNASRSPPCLPTPCGDVRARGIQGLVPAAEAYGISRERAASHGVEESLKPSRSGGLPPPNSEKSTAERRKRALLLASRSPGTATKSPTPLFPFPEDPGTLLPSSSSKDSRTLSVPHSSKATSFSRGGLPDLVLLELQERRCTGLTSPAH
nr:uncharacterized protein LOC123573594 [Macaca fascicularis]